jgi:hypothetical protein
MRFYSRMGLVTFWAISADEFKVAKATGEHGLRDDWT